MINAATANIERENHAPFISASKPRVVWAFNTTILSEIRKTKAQIDICPHA
jgi:hypothetical protein